MINAGITDFASSLGTNGIVKQYDFTKIAITKLIKRVKNWNMIGFVVFAYHILSSYFFRANYLISWVSLIFDCLKAGFVTCPEDKLTVPDLTSRDLDFCIVDGCYRNWYSDIMMTSSNGNIFHVTGPLCGEFTGPRWIPLTRASDAELWCFLWSAHEQAFE